MRTREELVEDEADARVRMLREAVERTATPSEYKKYLLLDVIETYLPVPEDERERWEELLSREENRAVRDFARTWAERLMLTGFFEGKRQTPSLGIFRLGLRAASMRSPPRMSSTPILKACSRRALSQRWVSTADSFLELAPVVQCVAREADVSEARSPHATIDCHPNLTTKASSNPVDAESGR